MIEYPPSYLRPVYPQYESPQISNPYKSHENPYDILINPHVQCVFQHRRGRRVWASFGNMLDGAVARAGEEEMLGLQTLEASGLEWGTPIAGWFMIGNPI